jgi:hypothetical protein
MMQNVGVTHLLGLGGAQSRSYRPGGPTLCKVVQALRLLSVVHPGVTELGLPGNLARVVPTC